jgi:transposase InsO family protein
LYGHLAEVPVPWKEITQVEQRRSFIHTVFLRRKPMAQICAEFQISEKTGYKWLRRYLKEGDQSLEDRSHAPHTIPHRMPAEVAEYLLTLRRRHPTWGPRKLVAYAAAHEAARQWPAASSVGALLKHAGLVRMIRYRKTGHAGTAWGRTAATVPNAVWTADFKGQFRLGNGAYCFPLTVLDACSRYLLGCRAMESTRGHPVIDAFRRVFREYGMPAVIRTDNGPPFGSGAAIARLSPLAVWWIRLGIRPERITPGQPQENGAHERMHRTLKAETTRPAAASWRGQQQRFDLFRMSYNNERPHEALGQRAPRELYTASPRPFPKRLPPLEYPPGTDVRRVTSIGQTCWRGTHIFLSSLLAGQDVGIEQVTEQRWTVAFGPLILGHVNAVTSTFEPAVYWRPSPITPDSDSPINPV